MVLVLAFAFFAWRSVDRAINLANVSTWAAPIIWFSLFLITFSLCAVFVKEASVMAIITLVASLLSAIFAFSLVHLIFIALGSLCLISAAKKIRKDLSLNIKVDFWKTIRDGSTYIILAIAIIISSQYYFEVRYSGIGKIIPKFQMNGFFSSVAPKILSSINPKFKGLDNENLTVDQFILETQSEQNNEQAIQENSGDQIDKMIDDQYGKNLRLAKRNEIKKQYLTKLSESSNEIASQNQDLILQQGRSQLEGVTGFPLTGQEKIYDIFVRVINDRINSYITPNFSDQNNFPVLPLVIAIVLFITIFYLGSFLSPVLIFLANIVFRILLKTKVIKISKVQIEAEIIE